jgi:NAD(P)H-hydrate epimerase
LVTLATARSIIPLAWRNSEVTLLPLPEASTGILGPVSAPELNAQIKNYQALLLGPGLGRSESVRSFIAYLLGLKQAQVKVRVGFRISNVDEWVEAEDATEAVSLPPTVLDADALNALAQNEDWFTQLPPNRFILTPHHGEMKRLLDLDELDSDLHDVATTAAQRWEQVVVLKGATTIIAAPNGESVIHAAGNPALATAGTGDVLAGVIAGLLAHGLELFAASILGVYLHSLAGALVQEDLGEMGTVASDLLPRLPLAINNLRLF